MNTRLCLGIPLIDPLANNFCIYFVSLLISAHIKKLCMSLMQDCFGYLADPGEAMGCSTNTCVNNRLRGLARYGHHIVATRLLFVET